MVITVIKLYLKYFVYSNLSEILYVKTSSIETNLVPIYSIDLCDAPRNILICRAAARSVSAYVGVCKKKKIFLLTYYTIPSMISCLFPR